MTDESDRLNAAELAFLLAATRLLRHYVPLARQEHLNSNVTYAQEVIAFIEKAIEAGSRSSHAVFDLKEFSRVPPENVPDELRAIHRVAAFASAIIGNPDIRATSVDVLAKVANQLIHPLEPSSRYLDELLGQALKRLAQGNESEMVYRDDLEKASAAEREAGFSIYIDPGDADAEDIRDVLVALNDLHKAAGGAGLRYSVDGGRILVAELA